jgi:hypothetical protein
VPGHDLRVLLDAMILPLYAAKAPGAASVLAGFTDEQLATVAAFLRALADETDENGATGATG